MVNIYGEVDNGVTLVHIKKFSSLPLTICAHKTGIQAVAYRGGGVGVFKPPRNSEDIGGVLDRKSKKNRRLDFLL